MAFFTSSSVIILNEKEEFSAPCRDSLIFFILSKSLKVSTIFERVFSCPIFFFVKPREWVTSVKWLLKVFAIAFLSCKIFSSSTKIIAFAILHLFENFGLIVYQNFLLSVTILTSMLVKYCFLLSRKILTQILRCFLHFSKLMVVQSKFYLLFNLDLVIMAFLKVLFMKGLLLYQIYFWFKGAHFSRVKLKVVSKLLRESSVSDKFNIRVSSKNLLSKFLWLQ